MPLVISHRCIRARSAFSAWAIALAMAFTLGGCGSVDKDATSKWDADRLYNEARQELLDNNWSHARDLFEKLEARYPFGRYAQQAQLEAAYCYYKEGETEEVMSTTDRFLKLNANSPHADYAYYLRGLTNFIDPPHLLGALVHYQVSERDPKSMLVSFDSFKELLNRYPNSAYREDALLRLVFLRDALADHDVRVADYYFRRGAYLAAVNRAENTVREYQGSPRVEQALGIMVRSYDKLGMTQLKDDAARVLKASFPGSSEALHG